MHYGIIAAGEGSRLRQEGVPYPKPLVPLQGTPMIERLIGIFIANHATAVSVIVNQQMTDVQAFLKALAPRLPVPLNVLVQSTPSSMHSLWELSHAFFHDDTRFIVTTVDTIFRPEAFRPYAEALRTLPEGIDGCMAVTPYIDDEKPLYVGYDPSTDIITQYSDTPLPQMTVSGGIYGLTRPCLKVLDRCVASGMSRMRNYQRALVADGLRLRAFDIPKIMDIDHASDIAKAQAFLAYP